MRRLAFTPTGMLASAPRLRPVPKWHSDAVFTRIRIALALDARTPIGATLGGQVEVPS